MQAIILAAGQGTRLADFNPDGRPKSLLEFDGKSLLARQLNDLYRLGIHRVTLVVGFEADMIIEHVATLDSRPEVAYVYNPAYAKGSVLSLLAAQEVLRSGEPVLILAADVLFHSKILKVLLESVHQNCALIDRDNKPRGESVGFYKISGEMAKEVADACASYNSDGLLDASYEEVFQEVSLRHPLQVACEDVSGLPWLSLDCTEDIERAIKDVLPAIRTEL